MNIHEYQAKELLAKFGVAVPAGYPALTVDEAVAAASKLSVAQGVDDDADHPVKCESLSNERSAGARCQTARFIAKRCRIGRFARDVFFELFQRVQTHGAHGQGRHQVSGLNQVLPKISRPAGLCGFADFSGGLTRSQADDHGAQ